MPDNLPKTGSGYCPVYVFDLDGVITNPSSSRVNESVTDAMRLLLAAGFILAVNTGRSFEWVEQNLLERLRHDGHSRIFDRFVAVCEKGGEMAILQNNRWSVTPSEFAVAHDTYEIARTTFNQAKDRLKSMFWDNTKRTMASIEKLPSADLDTFHAEQRMLVSMLSESLSGHEIRIDATTIATDVESPRAGKYAGAQLIYTWVRPLMGEDNRSCRPSFISIGDSASDYDMARYFAEQGADSTCIYVGMPADKILYDERVKFVATTAHYDAGTLEFLAAHTT